MIAPKNAIGAPTYRQWSYYTYSVRVLCH